MSAEVPSGSVVQHKSGKLMCSIAEGRSGCSLWAEGTYCS